MSILIFSAKNPTIWKFKLDFFSVKNVIDFFPKLSKLSFNKLLMTRSIKKFKKYFFQKKKHRLWNLMSEFFPIAKVFRRLSKTRQIYGSWALSEKFWAKSKNLSCPHPSTTTITTTIHHPSVTVKKNCQKNQKTAFKFESKKLFPGEDIKQKETQIGTP